MFKKVALSLALIGSVSASDGQYFNFSDRAEGGKNSECAQNTFEDFDSGGSQGGARKVRQILEEQTKEKRLEYIKKELRDTVDFTEWEIIKLFSEYGLTPELSKDLDVDLAGAAVFSDNDEILEWLLDKGYDLSGAFNFASDLVMLNKRNPKLYKKVKNKLGFDAILEMAKQHLTFKCSSGHIEEIQEILELDGRIVNAPIFIFDKTLLVKALENQDVKLTAFLIKNGADIHQHYQDQQLKKILEEKPELKKYYGKGVSAMNFALDPDKANEQGVLKHNENDGGFSYPVGAFD